MRYLLTTITYLTLATVVGIGAGVIPFLTLGFSAGIVVGEIAGIWTLGWLVYRHCEHAERQWERWEQARIRRTKKTDHARK